MNAEQKKALMELRQAKGAEEAAFSIYRSSPSGFLGGIERSCRHSAVEAAAKREAVQREALAVGVAPEVVYGTDRDIMMAMLGMEVRG